MLNFLLAFENLKFDATVLRHTLNFLWQGLLAIFVVIGLIILAVKITSLVINKCDEAKKKREVEKNDSQNKEA
ncbi:MAG: hypothetical protein IJX88_01525 [Clostridia bacterium]|nr:hypothetical protein [Clostridia bacterium]